MRLTIPRSIILSALLAAAPACGGAQQGLPATSPPPAGASRLAAGAYTAGQAEDGEIGFGVLCAACHGDFDLLFPGFAQKWSGQSLQEIYLKIKNSMPENDPGTLSPVQTVQLMAYMLSRQGFPAGEEPLVPDEAVLAEILIHPPVESPSAQNP